jgi:hypothetical protein
MVSRNREPMRQYVEGWTVYMGQSEKSSLKAHVFRSPNTRHLERRRGRPQTRNAEVKSSVPDKLQIALVFTAPSGDARCSAAAIAHSNAKLARLSRRFGSFACSAMWMLREPLEHTRDVFVHIIPVSSLIYMSDGPIMPTPQGGAGIARLTA